MMVAPLLEVGRTGERVISRVRLWMIHVYIPVRGPCENKESTGRYVTLELWGELESECSEASNWPEGHEMGSV